MMCIVIANNWWSGIFEMKFNIEYLNIQIESISGVLLVIDEISVEMQLYFTGQNNRRWSALFLNIYLLRYRSGSFFDFCPESYPYFLRFANRKMWSYCAALHFFIFCEKCYGDLNLAKSFIPF